MHGATIIGQHTRSIKLCTVHPCNLQHTEHAIIGQHVRNIKLCTAQPLLANMLGASNYARCNYYCQTCSKHKTMHGVTITGQHARNIKLCTCNHYCPTCSEHKTMHGATITGRHARSIKLCTVQPLFANILGP